MLIKDVVAFKKYNSFKIKLHFSNIDMSQSADNFSELNRYSLNSLLTKERISINIKISSKKRMLEELADLLSRDLPILNQHTVFSVLNERERLGSTGIGHGIALPHGRLNGIHDPIAAVMKLSQPLEFDSIDNLPISLVIGLLVPAEATNNHLQILSSLANAFSDPGLRKKIFAAQDTESLFNLFT